jgi:hypothetical protein
MAWDDLKIESSDRELPPDVVSDEELQPPKQADLTEADDTEAVFTAPLPEDDSTDQPPRGIESVEPTVEPVKKKSRRRFRHRRRKPGEKRADAPSGTSTENADQPGAVLPHKSARPGRDDHETPDEAPSDEEFLIF